MLKLGSNEPVKTILRTQLHDFSMLLKKMSNVLLSMESAGFVSLIEPQVPSRLAGLAGSIASLESLERDEGELFASLLASLINTIQGINMVRKNGKSDEEFLTKLLRVLKNLEETGKDFIPNLISIDEKRKKNNHETLSGLLQKFIDMVQEKRHLLSR